MSSTDSTGSTDTDENDDTGLRYAAYAKPLSNVSRRARKLPLASTEAQLANLSKEAAAITDLKSISNIKSIKNINSIDGLNAVSRDINVVSRESQLLKNELTPLLKLSNNSRKLKKFSKTTKKVVEVSEAYHHANDEVNHHSNNNNNNSKKLKKLFKFINLDNPQNFISKFCTVTTGVYILSDVSYHGYKYKLLQDKYNSASLKSSLNPYNKDYKFVIFERFTFQLITSLFIPLLSFHYTAKFSSLYIFNQTNFLKFNQFYINYFPHLSQTSFKPFNHFLFKTEHQNQNTKKRFPIINPFKSLKASFLNLLGLDNSLSLIQKRNIYFLKLGPFLSTFLILPFLPLIDSPIDSLMNRFFNYLWFNFTQNK
ncbi:uncharacterized protein ASCRUDRAFT_77816 [Ascoidea rubescens DSM 1968]|uniref:Uncharacterized protein n=1 Tax=Ascoidea rubescens DSM 1968 TaxID=1344418 RepID=A0A1D2VAI5_9ASCO|nr:hypothetical protein ASCRUDRAFT_77816 [Ascoidea rubescens DSM 1968]ODV58565.1 hypothetical protein ASCRUDRAFT_77816 [Ascoidea rubescens DSM 1968]